MNEVPGLTLDFLKKHPQDAAQALQSLPTNVCRDFFQTVSPSLAAGLVGYMSFDRAALLIAALPAPVAASIVEKMKPADAAVVLRLLPSLTLDSLLSELPKSRKKKYSNQTHYPAHVVGAWMDAFPIEIGETLNVEDTRRWLRQQNRNLDYDFFVVGPQGTVVGMVTLSRLALAKNNVPIVSLMTTEFKRIRDRDNLESVRNLEDWDHYTALPVVNHNQQLVGALTRRSLEKALALGGPNATSAEMVPLFGEMFRGYLEGMIHVVDWFVQQPPSSDKKTSRRED